MVAICELCERELMDDICECCWGNGVMLELQINDHLVFCEMSIFIGLTEIV